LACLAALALSATADAQRLIAEGELWKYYPARSSGPPNDLNGYNWTQQAYDDSAGWKEGPSGFGYGDADDTTYLNDMLQIAGTQAGYAAVFIRKTFTVLNPAAVSRLSLAVDYDDGFAAYVNGVEVARRSLPAGPLTHTTLASGHEASRGDASSNPQERVFITIDPALLVAGMNVIAISGHNASLTSSDFSLIPELYAGVNLLRGPYLQMPNASAMTIVWRTDAATDSALDYGFDTTYSGGTLADPNAVREHELTIPNLQPNETYHYRVRSGGVTLAASTFRAPPATVEPFRFTVVGDFGYAHSGTTLIANRIADAAPDLQLTVGDNIYNPVGGSGTGQPGVYDRYWFTPYAAAMRKAPIFPALGNHDIETANGSWYLSYFRLPPNGPLGELERNYSFDYSNAHFAVIDSNAFVNPPDATRSAAIKNWLAADLAATSKPWKFVVYHHPAYTSGGPGVHDPEIIMQNEIQPICAQYGVQIVFQGHNHWYERINPISAVNYIVTGAGGRNLTNPSIFPAYSAMLNNTTHSFSRVDINDGTLTLTQVDAAGAPIDKLTLRIDHLFNIDGLLDSTAWERAANGLKLHAAIRGNHLYLATQDAGEGHDHFIYVSNQTGALRAANWSKLGQVMTWSAFLADENGSGLQGWFGAAEQPLTNPEIYSATTSGLNNNGAAANGVLEGTIDLPAHFGAFPAQLYISAAPYDSPDGGALIANSQVPAGNGDGNLDPNEFLVLNTRDIALDLPTSEAGPPQSAEAGMRVALNGSGSGPSGLPISFAWSQLAGLAVEISGANTLQASFAATTNVALPTDLTFRLRVNDTRFNTDDAVTIQLFPMVDSDGDGLSDQEELTGSDNALTFANPGGITTDPQRSDSDGDGMSDGDEAIAGTDPNSASSAFRIVNVNAPGGSLTVEWSCVPGRSYQLQTRSDFFAPWQDTGATITASGESCSVTVLRNGAARFYRVRLLP
jgi:3',5'-cyclic AMP phosphodiesterase CpdA